MPNNQGFITKELDPRTELILDPENPRLPRDCLGASQERLLEVLLDRFDIIGLMSAIVASGYLERDPIAGVEEPDHRVRVREGNRRLAALKLFLEPALAPAKWTTRVSALAAELDDASRASIDRIAVEVWSDPNDSRLLNYIGYRHVTGIRQWAPAEKARFIAHMIETHQSSYQEVANALGSKPRHVERHYLAFRLVEQAYQDEVPGTEEMEDAFGVLIRALQSKGIPEFLGITYTGNTAKASRPIDEDHDEALRDFVRWTFGTDEAPKVLLDSRDLTKWARVLSTDRGIDYLRRHKSPNFDRAWQESGGETDTIRELLLAAADNMRDVVAVVPDHREEEDVVQAFGECACFFVRLLPAFPDVRNEVGL